MGKNAERIIILGAGVMQGPAIRIAKELGFFAVAVDGSPAAPCIGTADQFEQIDLKDKEEIEAFARVLQNSGGLGGIMTAGTDFSATVAWVAEKLGLPGIPYETALDASDKARMRSRFKEAGLPSPEFFTVSGSGALDEPSLPFPLVVKPVDNMGSRGCRRVDSMEEFREAALDALRFSRCGRAIVETFMDGPEFSVDAIIYRGEITICGLADRHIFFPPYFIEMGHTMPTAFARERQEALLEAFCKGVHALGLSKGKNIGAAKGDIKLTPKGPMLGEIAARLSGGYMSGWTYPYSSGVEPIRAAILAAMGRKPDGLEPLKTWTCAERAFISIPGTVMAITGTEKARGLPFVKDVFFRIEAGSKVDFPQNNVTKCGNIISAAPERDAAAEAAETAARSVLIRLDPSDKETALFLGTGNREQENSPVPRSPIFPPDAFQISPELRAELSRLPDTSFASLPANGGNLRLIAFPAFMSSELRDYAGRTVAESLEAVRELAGLSLQEISAEYAVKHAESSDNDYSFLGRSFWAALARGGYQGAAYYIYQLRE